MSIVGFIFARGGSKGLPNKNIRNFAGKPLIAWSIEQAKSAQKIDRIIVSTDSPRIAEIARECGADVPFIRPGSLAADDSPEILAWKHALNFMQDAEGILPDAMVSIPSTAPLRISKDIDACVSEFESYRPDLVITLSESSRNPYFNMVKISENFLVKPVIESTIKYTRRQDCPATYDIATVCYVADPAYILKCESIFDGNIRGLIIPKERALDIDNLFDFELAEHLLRKRTTDE